MRLILRDAARLASYTDGGQLTLTEQGHRLSVHIPAQLPDDPEPIQRLLVACKAYDAERAVAGIAQRLSPGAEILLLQNGLGSQNAVAALVPGARCICVSSTEGAFRDEDWSVVFAGQGFNWLGDTRQGPAPRWLDELAAAGIPHQWTADIMERLWRKLALNCTINPLTVLYGCRNGDLTAHQDEVRALCDELIQVLQACGQPLAAVGLHEEVIRVIQATAANYSSMYQDVAQGRRTENSYLLGYVCASAAEYRCDTPHLNRIRQQLIEHLTARGLPSN